MRQGLPTLTKSFKAVALWAMDRMREETESGVGKVSFRDYHIVINRYLIPYFDQTLIRAARVAVYQKSAITVAVRRRGALVRKPPPLDTRQPNTLLTLASFIRKIAALLRSLKR